MEQIRLGLIGCGNMGKSLGRGLRGVEAAAVVAVADVNPEHARAAAAELGGEGAVGDTIVVHPDPRTLVADDQIQAVIVATPPSQHRQWIEAAARAGKHVFAEKPLASTVADCDGLLQVVHEAGVQLMVGQVCRFHSVHRRVKELVQEGAIGEPWCLTIHRLGGPWGNIGGREWRLSRRDSGGTLMEINAHEIDWARWVMGEVKRTYAVGGNFLNPAQDYPDVVLLTLQFADGGVGWLHSSQASQIGGYGARVDGSEGSIVVPCFWGGEAGLHWKRSGQEGQWIPAAEIPTEPPVQAEVRAFIEAVRHGQAPPVTGHDGRMAVAIAEAAYRSMESGQPEEVE